MVTSDCGCGDYFKEDDEQEQPLRPWRPVMTEPSYFEPMHVHAMPIQRPESAYLPNPEPAIGLPLAATPATIQQPGLPQVPFPQQNVIAFPQPAFQPPMFGTGLNPQQIPLQMPQVPNIGRPMQQQLPPPGMGQPVPFGAPLVPPPPPIMQPNQPGFGHPGGQPVMMPPMNPHNFNMNPQNLAAVQL